jgi:hypothetical protein
MLANLGKFGGILIFSVCSVFVQNGNIQGGSDKSGIFNIFLENPTAQLKIIRF